MLAANVPGAQVVQAPALAPELEPAGHSMQDDEPGVLYVPDWQVPHVVAPAVELNWPAGHLWQVELPVPVLNEPGAHAVQAFCPALEELPAAQAAHVVVLLAKVPAAHALHAGVPASGAIVPAVQLVQVFWPGAED